LRFNICRLERLYQTDDQVEDLAVQVTEYISPTLLYACRYWSVHLLFSPAIINTHQMLLDLLYNRLLFWMEVLSLSGCMRRGTPMMSQVQIWLQVRMFTQHKLALSNAHNFVTWFAANPCSQSTPHIYISALPLCAKCGWVYYHYLARTRGLSSITSQQDEAVLATWNTELALRAVAVSPDGECIASSHKDGTIHIYDTQTGVELAEPIQAETSYVASVTFSPTGLHIASSCADISACIWDTYSGEFALGLFEFHKDYVQSVAFLPDGSHMASGS
ncbi:WD40-repeat-containing domain protein, partial [Rhizoctonia solani]